jgi:hypothetical protein
MWELHSTRRNQYTRHWFITEQVNDRDDNAIFWTSLPSCKDQACGFWRTCYNCNNCPTTLIVNRAEFLDRKEFESEQEPPKNPNELPPIHPHTAPFMYSHLTEPDNFSDPEQKKDVKWRSSKSL